MEWFDLIYKAVVLLGVIGGGILALIKWVIKQDHEDEKNTTKVSRLEQRHKKDMLSVNEELCIMTYGILACLKGLQEQGCNGPVTRAINDIEKHLNKNAHK